MKKHLSVKAVVVASFFISGMLASCTKEAGVKPGSRQSESTQSPDHSTQKTPPSVNFFKTPFISQVNTTTITDTGSVLVFDFTLRKSFEKGENGLLAISYGDGQFVSRGWKYEISIDTTTNAILLSPNDKMKAAIIPGSFKTVAATFDVATQNFNFITRFKELNGNKSEVAETIFKRF